MVNKQAQQAVQQTLDNVTGDPKTGIAGIVFVAIDKNGDQIAAVPSGKKGNAARRDSMDLDTVSMSARSHGAAALMRLCRSSGSLPVPR